MIAFSQGINLNAETQVQQSLTRTLTHILEEYFVYKLKQANLLNVAQGSTNSHRHHQQSQPTVTVINNSQSNNSSEQHQVIKSTNNGDCCLESAQRNTG